MDFDLTQMEYVHWLALAGVFFVLEVLTLSFFFLWLGLAAVIVGLIMLVVGGIVWQGQFLLWAGLSVAAFFAWRYHKHKNPNATKSEEPLLNKRGEQYIGRILTLEEPIVNGFGKVKVDDSIWRVEAEADIPAGAKIRIKGLSGTVLLVETA